MGVDTTMFITSKKESILEIMPIVLDKLNEWIRNELDNYADTKGFDNRMQFLFRDKDSPLNKGLKDFTNGVSKTDTYDFRSFNTCFTISGESRQLFITHSCSNDYKDIYEGEKIIFSLGCWGLSHEIMMVIADSIKDKGNIYYCENDCEGDFKLINFTKIED